MSTADIVWNVLGLIFLVSLFTILFLVKKGSFLMIDDEDKGM